MKITFDILRQKGPDTEPYRQKISYETADEKETVASALIKINEAALLKEGDPCVDFGSEDKRPIRWQSSCLQKKCGACAMVINGRPGLACDAFLKNYVKKGRGNIALEPLSKFPVIEDLLVDRSIMFENLKTLKVYSESALSLKQKKVSDAYEASRCLQCGCCLEVCPNFASDEGFFGAAGFVPTSRLLLEMSKDQRGQIKAAYKDHIYKTCAKSLACENICPAGIDINRLLSKSNSIALWRR